MGPKASCPTIANCPRFLVLTNWNNEAVLDKETGLVWERSPATTTHTWSEARFQCTARTTGNRKGWRLPSIHELASLVHPSVASPGPTLLAGHPFTDVQWRLRLLVGDDELPIFPRARGSWNSPTAT